MVITCSNPPQGGGSTSDEVICMIIAEEAATTIREGIPEMFGFIKTMLIENFDERYAAVTEDAAAATLAAARPQGG